MCVFKVPVCVLGGSGNIRLVSLLMTQLFYSGGSEGIPLCVLIVLTVVSTALQTQTGAGSDEAGATVQGNGSGDATGVS